jgi:hypothetical protein
MNEKQDRLIEKVAAELRQPVEVDPAARARLLSEVRRTESSPAAGEREVRRRRPGLRSGVLAAAAVLALVALAVWLPGPGGEAGSPSAGVRPVQFVFISEEASEVSLVGDFNDWDITATPMRRGGPGHVWSVVVSLPRGPHRYAFVVDGREWMTDGSALRAAGDDFGVPSNLIFVDDAAS